MAKDNRFCAGILLGFLVVATITGIWVVFLPTPAPPVVTLLDKSKATITYNDKTYLTERGFIFWEVEDGVLSRVSVLSPTSHKLRDAYKIAELKKEFGVKPPVEKN